MPASSKVEVYPRKPSAWRSALPLVLTLQLTFAAAFAAGWTAEPSQVWTAAPAAHAHAR